MSAPKRLLEDPDTAEALRADLQAVVDHRLGYDLAAGVARFEASLATTGAAGSVGSSLALKLGAIGVVAGGLGLAVFVGSESTTSPPTALDQSPQSSEPVREPQPTSPRDPKPEPVREPVATPSEPASEPAREAHAESPPTPVPRVRAIPTQKPVAAAKPSAGPSDLLAREVQQLRLIRQTLGSNPSRALDMATTGHREFRGGVLYQEREALALQALNALGRKAELERRGQRYLQAFPNGSFSDRVRNMLQR